MITSPKESLASLKNRVLGLQWEKIILDGNEGARVTRRLDARFRVSLPADLCEHLGLQPNDFVELIIVRKIDKPK